MLKILNQTSIILLLSANIILADVYPDQYYVIRGDSIFSRIESNNGLELSENGYSLELQDGILLGYVTLKPDSSDFPFNRGLPSWNGTVSDDNSGFSIQMRFPYGNGWSPWLTAGFWEEYIWSSYGSTSYAGGEIDYDYVKLDNYQKRWQFRIYIKRENAEDPSPTIHKLSFFVSDTRTTDTMDFNQILNDNPEEIFIETDFLYQYSIDDDIGGSICSPTSVSMILRSYEIDVDPYEFAVDTYDPYYHMFGIWPRVVQNASEYGMDGAVTRYRSWNEAREVLTNGGCIAMSVGPPLYSGHLMMLAGFTDDGSPLVHDPAKSNGYGNKYRKIDLSHSWFDKGGISYTFYPADSQLVAIEQEYDYETHPNGFQLYQNYPNPFNPITTIEYQLPSASDIKLEIFNITGQIVSIMEFANQPPGNYTQIFNGENLASGTYFYRLQAGSFIQTRKMILLR